MMTKSLLIMLLVLGCSTTAIAACKGCPKTKGKDMTASQFFASALTNDQFRIALCRPRTRKPLKALHKYTLNTGESLLRSSYTDYTKSVGYKFLCVTEAIKGDFDRIVVYEEYLMYGRIWPAFNNSSFIPSQDTQWLVVFREDADGEKIEFEDSDRKLPVLQLASKEYGIIRYEGANHLGIDAKEFLSDLRILVKHVKKSKKVAPNQLKTELGKEILGRLSQHTQPPE